jgi:hypothetical protein
MAVLQRLFLLLDCPLLQLLLVPLFISNNTFPHALQILLRLNYIILTRVIFSGILRRVQTPLFNGQGLLVSSRGTAPGALRAAAGAPQISLKQQLM